MERIKFPLALSLSLVIAACGSIEVQPDPEQTKSRSRPAFSFELNPGGEAITVKAGDTINDLARQYGATTRQIVIINNIRPPYEIRKGQKLRLPLAQKLYQIEEGDTLNGIATNFRVPPEEIAAINFIPRPYRIVQGDWLGIPLQKEELAKLSKASPRGPSSRQLNGKTDKFTISSEPLKPLPDNRAPEVVAQAKAEKPQLGEQKPRNKAVTAVTKSTGFLAPVDGPVVADFGSQADGRRNDGINISAPRGTPVRAAQKGEVIYSGDALQGYGNLILIRHDGGYVSAYAHMDTVLAKRGTLVTRGETIGTVGSSGGVSSPQLHFEIRKNNTAIDPAGLFSSR